MNNPGSLLSALCFGLLAIWRVADGQPEWAVVFALAAAVSLYLAFRPDGSPAPVPDRPLTDAKGRPNREMLQRTLDVYRKRLHAWAAIVAVSWIGAVAGLVGFPPMALLLAAAGVFSTIRYRRYRRSVAGLTRLLQTGVVGTPRASA